MTSYATVFGASFAPNSIWCFYASQSEYLTLHSCALLNNNIVVHSPPQRSLLFYNLSDYDCSEVARTPLRGSSTPPVNFNTAATGTFTLFQPSEYDVSTASPRKKIVLRAPSGTTKVRLSFDKVRTNGTGALMLTVNDKLSGYEGVVWNGSNVTAMSTGFSDAGAAAANTDRNGSATLSVASHTEWDWVYEHNGTVGGAIRIGSGRVPVGAPLETISLTTPDTFVSGRITAAWG